MEGQAFDHFAKQASRRRTLGGLLAGVAGLAAGIGTTRKVAALPRDCRRFAISGGAGTRGIRENFNYDDDMKITLVKRNGQRDVLLNDRDGEIGVGGRDVDAIAFAAVIGDELKIVVKDRQARCYSLEPLYLHCCQDQSCRISRDSFRLTRGVERTCSPANRWRRRTFFREAYTIE